MANRSVGGQNASAEGSPRWWRWRRRSTVNISIAAAPVAAAGLETWRASLDRMCQQIIPYLPPFTASTRKAILSILALVVVWKFVIWTLELVVTGACFALAVAILLCFVRPDLALTVVTQVLPPHVDTVRAWLSGIFLRAGQSLDRGPPGTSTLPLPAPHSTPVPRSPRTTVTRSIPEAAFVYPPNA